MALKHESVVVITGSSTGIGFETSLAFARNGYRTFATMRDLSKAEPIKKIVVREQLSLKVVQMDVDDSLLFHRLPSCRDTGAADAVGIIEI